MNGRTQAQVTVKNVNTNISPSSNRSKVLYTWCKLRKEVKPYLIKVDKEY